jgi:hypothetical protein
MEANPNQYRLDFIKHICEHGKKKFENFEPHVIESNDTVQIIEWSNKNGSFEYRIRFIFDINTGNMFVSGDLGSAVFQFTEKARLEEISRYSDFNYFQEKMQCTTDITEYDSEYARLQLEENLGLENDINEPDIQTLIHEIMQEVDQYDGHPVYSDYVIDKLKDCDEDYWEWLYGIGILPHRRIILWWEALHEIRARLEKGGQQR